MKKINTSIFSSKKGYSLFEVVIAGTIFALVSAGIASTTMMSSQVALENIHEKTAHMIAQSYAEQIKAIPFEVVARSLANPQRYSLPTETVANGGKTQASAADRGNSLVFGATADKKVALNMTGRDGNADKTRTMSFRVRPEGRDLRSEFSDWNAIEITLHYEWDVVAGNGIATRSRQINLVKTDVFDH